jgi:hypothetical protein
MTETTMPKLIIVEVEKRPRWVGSWLTETV